MQTSIISAQSLSKLVSTNQVHLSILKQVNLSIQAGESVAIVGASGAGKSTLMTLLAGLDTPREGKCICWKPLSQLDDDARAALRSESVGFVFQSFLLIPSLSALENVTLPCKLKGEAEDRERAEKLLKAVGLENRMYHSPAQLSGGEQQRVAIARAFKISP